jgi:hypothetical protein
MKFLQTARTPPFRSRIRPGCASSRQFRGTFFGLGDMFEKSADVAEGEVAGWRLSRNRIRRRVQWAKRTGGLSWPKGQ